jgi:hypothetical protein
VPEPKFQPDATSSGALAPLQGAISRRTLIRRSRRASTLRLPSVTPSGWETEDLFLNLNLNLNRNGNLPFLPGPRGGEAKIKITIKKEILNGRFPTSQSSRSVQPRRVPRTSAGRCLCYYGLPVLKGIANLRINQLWLTRKNSFKISPRSSRFTAKFCMRRR